MPVSSARDLPEARRCGASPAAWQHEQRNSTAIRQTANVFREQDRAFDRIRQRQIAVAANGLGGWSIGSHSCRSCRGGADGRLWRSVLNRRWYSDQRGDTPGSREVVLGGV